MDEILATSIADAVGLPLAVQATTVYCKTDKGLAEIRQYRGTVSTSARQLLILIDGRRTIAELAAMVGASRLESLLPQLAGAGLVQRELDGVAQIATKARGALAGATTPPRKAPAPAPVHERPVVAAQPSSAPPAEWVDRVDDPALAVPARQPGRNRRMPVLFALALALALGGALASWLLRAGVPEPSDRNWVEAAPAEAAPIPARAFRGTISLARPASAPQDDVPAQPRHDAKGGDAVSALLPESAGQSLPPLAPAPRVPERVSESLVGSSTPRPASADARPTARLGAPLGKGNPAPSAPSAATGVPASTSAPAGAAIDALDRRAGSNAVAPAAPPPPVPAPGDSSTAPPTVAPPALAVRVRVTPAFPLRAMRNGIDRGRVSARVQIGADGMVQRVDILSSIPPRVFDQAVRDALLQWQFEPPLRATETTLNFEFKS